MERFLWIFLSENKLELINYIHTYIRIEIRFRSIITFLFIYYYTCRSSRLNEIRIACFTLSTAERRTKKWNSHILFLVSTSLPLPPPNRPKSHLPKSQNYGVEYIRRDLEHRYPYVRRHARHTIPQPSPFFAW